jgi:hypothetical protein
MLILMSDNSYNGPTHIPLGGGKLHDYNLFVERNINKSLSKWYYLLLTWGWNLFSIRHINTSSDSKYKRKFSTL